MKRIMILGQPGAGKSTLARDLGRVSGLPVVHIDLIHWMPGWTERQKPEKLRLIAIEEAKDRWIIEGGLSQSWDNRMHRADMLIHLDFPLWLRAWRVFKRTLTSYGRTRPDLPENCPERFDREFWQWIWNTRRTGRAKMLKQLDQANLTCETVYLRTRSQVARFLAEFETKYAGTQD